MHYRLTYLAVALLLTLALPVFAQVDLIPRDTVVPVVLDNTLSSTTNVVGDTFTSHCAGGSCSGFPLGSSFVGVITAIDSATANRPGQIEVQFTQASLPDGRAVPINGALSSLDPNAVAVDTTTGFWTARPGAAPDRNRFIAYGAGAGLLIGALSGNTVKGAALGAIAGWLFGATARRDQMARDVTVPAGTQFGILLTRSVRLPEETTPSPGPFPGRGPGECPTWIAFAGDVVPFTSELGVTMVPARATMEALGFAFRTGASQRQITIVTPAGRVTHRVGTATAVVNDRSIRLNAPSEVVRGTVFVPTDLVALASGSRVSWQESRGVLRVDPPRYNR